MKYSCNLIRDLLPLYCDQVCSKDSAEAVQEHINTCEECKNIYIGMQQNVSVDSASYEKQQLASMQEVKKKIKKRNTIFAAVGMVVGIFFVSIVIRVLLMAGVIIFAFQDEGKHYDTTDINDYGVFEEFNGYSKLDIFPKQLSDNVEVSQYSYYYADTFLDPTAQIYLECGYEEKDYLKEMERLAGIQEEYAGRIQPIVYDTDSFLYPAYVTIDADNSVNLY